MGSGGDRPLKKFVNVWHVEVNGDGSAVKLLRRAAAEFGKFVTKHEDRIADFEFRVHNAFAIGTGHAADFFCTEHVLVKFDGGRGVADIQVRGDGVKTVRNWFRCHNIDILSREQPT